jgi:hypothetical protein
MDDEMGMVTWKVSVELAEATAGIGEFFRAHHVLAPPHGHGPANEMVMVIVVDALVHAFCTKVGSGAVVVPGAHLAVKTPADAMPLVRMTGTVQLTAPASAARRSRALRSTPPSLDVGAGATISGRV